MKTRRGSLVSNLLFLQSNNVTKIYGEAAPAAETKRRKIAHKETFREQLEKEVEELGVYLCLVKHFYPDWFQLIRNAFRHRSHIRTLRTWQALARSQGKRRKSMKQKR